MTRAAVLDRCDRYGVPLSALMMGAVVFASLIPDPKLTDSGLVDQGKHFLAYLLLTIPIATSRAPVWLIASALLAIGAVVELVQPLAGRTMSLADFAANAAGIATGLLIGRWFRAYLRKGRV